MTRLRGIFARSVFRRMPENMPMNDLLAIIFHRFSATVYLVYSIWAIVSILSGIPSIIRTEGDLFQTVFSVLVLITAAPACLGATFWPIFARIELFAGSGFLGLIIYYLYFVFQNALTGEGTWAGFTLIWSIVILPACRTIVVVVLLLRQAREEKALVTLREAEEDERAA